MSEDELTADDFIYDPRELPNWARPDAPKIIRYTGFHVVCPNCSRFERDCVCPPERES